MLLVNMGPVKNLSDAQSCITLRAADDRRQIHRVEGPLRCRDGSVDCSDTTNGKPREFFDSTPSELPLPSGSPRLQLFADPRGSLISGMLAQVRAQCPIRPLVAIESEGDHGCFADPLVPAPHGLDQGIDPRRAELHER